MNILDYYTNIVDAPVEIRMNRAKANDTPPEILNQLSYDQFWFVRDLVASNVNTPLATLERLCNEFDFRISYDAKKTIEAIRHQRIDLRPSLLHQMQAAHEQSAQTTSETEITHDNYVTH